jgi:hypothetical protein
MEDIHALQQQYELTLVSSVPTKAAFMPGWPSSLFGFVLAVCNIISVALSSGSDNSIDGHECRRPWYKVCISGFIITLTYVVAVSWIITFVHIERDKATGGWLSVLSGISLFFSVLVLMDSGTRVFEVLPLFPLIFVIFLEVCGGLAVVIQRWAGDVGTIAYTVTDLNGCTPFNGTAYLQQGARSHAFRIIQNCEVVFMDLSFGLSFKIADDGNHSSIGLKVAWSVLTLILYIPEIIYEGIIAGKGTPVVISGDCMLVELNPRWGFLDSEIENWWKALEVMTGL